MRAWLWNITWFVLVIGNCSGTVMYASLNQAKSRKDTRVIDSLPAPNQKEIRKIRTADQWHNPYVIMHSDGYELILHDQARGQALLTLDELEDALLKMPLDRWPLGRVVAAQEIGLRSRGDDTKIAANLKALKRMLESHQVRVVQWPTA